MNKRSAHNEILHVLLIEDNIAHAELVMHGLKKHSVESKITHLSDGEAALDYLFRRGSYEEISGRQPHVILLDLRLPRIDGLQVLHEIKHSPKLQQIPVVILTTSDAEQDVKQAYASFANSYLLKPIEYSDLAQMLNDVSTYWLDWNYFPKVS